METKLIVLNGKHAGQEIRIPGPKFYIGRAEDCQLRPRSDLISRHHCAIIVKDAYVAVRDFGSKNGTFVNEERVQGEQQLQSGDKLQIGQLAFEVKLEVTVGGQKKPKVRSVQEAAARTVESAAAAEEEELDVSSWLAEDGGGSSDTKTLDLDEGPLPGSEAAASDSAGETAEDEPTKKEEEESKGPKTVGVWEKSKNKPKAASSREAAEDALKNFFRRF